MDKKTLEHEEEHLSHTINTLSSERTKLEDSLETVGKDNLERLKDLRETPETDSLDFYQFLEQIHLKNTAFNIKDKFKRLEEMDMLIKEPYFSRIDLTKDGDKSIDSYYIGKFGFSDNSGPIITDWRSKVASIYYRYRYPQKNVSYDTPEGLKIRDLALKRTFEIDNGTLLKYYNNDIQLDETEIIVEKLEQRTGGVLEDIVETIQESQLDIIESDPRKVCIVQGCVGSGKSTVAIHKLSHIFFNYPRIIKPERSILIAKNQILVSYLSTLFPKLGIFDINYKTLKDLIYNVLFREELKIKVDLNKSGLPGKYGTKKSNEIQRQINKIHRDYKKKIEKVFADEDFESFSSLAYSSNQTVFENITEIITDLNEELTIQKNYLKDNPDSTRQWLYKSNVEDLRKLIRKLNKIARELRDKTLPNISRKYGVNINEGLNWEQTLIFVFLYSELIGFRNTQEYEYCVVDEGQDFTPLEYLVLGKFVLHGRFCILGDLNQGYDDHTISNWDDIQEVIKEAKVAETFKLDTNYRSTKPIIEYSNKILQPYTDKYLPNSINRLGEEPQRNHYSDFNSLADAFREELSYDIKVIDRSIGIICFDNFDEIRSILNNLNLSEEKYVIIDENKSIHYIPKGVYLTKHEICKGLEFSKVYVIGKGLESVKNFNEAKKYFVAVTRAMNELSIYSY